MALRLGELFAHSCREQRSNPSEIIVARGHLHDHEKVGVFTNAKLEDLQRDPTDLRMANSDRRGSEVADRVSAPLLEFRAGVGQRRHDLRESRVIGSLTGGGSELTEHGPSGRLPSNHASAVLCVGEHHPEQVASPRPPTPQSTSGERLRTFSPNPMSSFCLVMAEAVMLATAGSSVPLASSGQAARSPEG